jgi:hypothetical protein
MKLLDHKVKIHHTMDHNPEPKEVPRTPKTPELMPIDKLVKWRERTKLLEKLQRALKVVQKLDKKVEGIYGADTDQKDPEQEVLIMQTHDNREEDEPRLRTAEDGAA